MRLSDDCRGRWHEILPQFGVSRDFLKNKHGPCPICGGKDRFRFDNKDMRGTFYCSRCGSGDGFKLAQLSAGKSFKEIIRQIEGMIGGIKPADNQANEITPSQIKSLKNDFWLSAKPPVVGGLVTNYFSNRGIGGYTPNRDIRELVGHSWSDPCTGERKTFSGMVAMVRRPDGSPDTLQRTQISHGVRLARLNMPGGISDGASVRLFESVGLVQGIAEGVETAIAASLMFNEPVDAAINQRRMLTWIPREGVKTVLLFGDNDANYSGQSHIYQLANRLSGKGYEVKVFIPSLAGTDWNDEYIKKLKETGDI